jgi:hypothetical protein
MLLTCFRHAAVIGKASLVSIAAQQHIKIQDLSPKILNEVAADRTY